MGLQRSVIVGVFGATTGLTVCRFSPEGVSPVQQTEIPWVGSVREGIYWPAEWLAEELDRIRAQARPGDVIALAMPGADLAILGPGDRGRAVPANPLQHYRGVMDGGFIEAVRDRIAPGEIYRRTRGVHVAAFQPYAQLVAYDARHPGVLAAAEAIVPLCDWMTERLSGRRGHDPVMLQDQGLAGDGRHVCEGILGMPGLAARIAPWPVFGVGRPVESDDGVLIMPVTHDSVPARMAGYSACPWVIWTGTWIGTACQVDDIRPTEEALAAGIAFEGAGPSLSAITNVAMLGRTYKEIVQAAGWSFSDAALQARDALSRRGPGIPLFPVDALPVHEEDAIVYLRGIYGTDPEELLAGVIASLAKACDDKIGSTERLLGQAPVEEVAIIGGWARNVAFQATLGRFYQRVRIPSQAAHATTVGLAAAALVGVSDAAGIGDALAMLPAMADA